jgi:hypothetical protein
MKYHSTTIPILVESAKKASIPLRNLYIVVGEANENRVDSTNGYTVIFTRFVVEGNNGVVYFTQTSHGLQELKQYTHFFYTHDTTVFLEQFWKNIENHAMTCATYIKVEETYSKSIGFLNVDWFLKNKKELFSYLANTDKTLLFNYKSGENYPRESQIRSLFPNLFVFLNEDIIFEYKDGIITINGHTFKNTIKRYHVKQYGGIDRLANVYEDPGLIKFQANYDLKSCGGWRLTL